MLNYYCFTLDYPPSTNNLYYTDKRGRRHLTDRGVKYKADMALLAYSQKVKPLVGPVMVEGTFYRPRRQGDLDNMLKIVFDSLKGIAWEDDEQVVEIHVKRREDPKNPRVELILSSPAPLGPQD